MDEIGDFMSSPVLTVDSESTVQEAAQFMHSHNIGSVIVCKFDKPIGIVTERDLTQKVVAGGLDPDSTLITEIMTEKLQTMDRYLPIDEANEFMHKNKIRHLAITEEDKIVGMLSVKDLVGYYTKSFKMDE
jgi:signal-transduction protein with cAMP-binding, CBS, and nucleotidyltransferase domain